MNQYRLPLAVFGLITLSAAGLFYFRLFPLERKEYLKDETAAFAYHRSNFFEYTATIERIAVASENVEAVSLAQVYGGVVPHHVPTALPLLFDFYHRLEKTRGVRTFVILGPDHVDAGRGGISVSRSSFVTPFGILEPDRDVIDAIAAKGLAVLDKEPFEREHSIDAQTLLISRFFPQAKIVPLIFRSSLTNVQAAAFGAALAELVGDEAFLVASVDFSHYLNAEQARPIDRLSADALSAMSSGQYGLVEADSPQALAAFSAYLRAKNGREGADVRVFNAADFGEKSDFTTGYIVGFFGASGEMGLKRESGRKLSRSREGEVVMVFVGDIMLSRAVGEVIKKKGARYPFLAMGEFLRRADVTFGNLESPISSRGVRVGSTYSFRADPETVEGLKYAGFDVVSIANNHIWDYGREAFEETLAILENAGIGYAGGGSDYKAAHWPIAKEVDGTRVAFLAYTDLLPRRLTSADSGPAVAFADLDEIIRDIAQAKSFADIVVVSFHWGDEYDTKHNRHQEILAKAAIDAGADLIVGHHPHAVQEVEKYNGGWIAYSLGNFVFDQNFSEETRRGLVLKVVLKGAKVAALESVAIRFNSAFQPYISNE